MTVHTKSLTHKLVYFLRSLKASLHSRDVFSQTHCLIPSLYENINEKHRSTSGVFVVTQV
jgi:hypothetical protein